MTKTTGPVLERRHVLVEVHELPEQLVRPHSGVWKRRWLAGENRRCQCLPLHEGFTFDGTNLTPHPFYLLTQIGRQDAGWIRVVQWRSRLPASFRGAETRGDCKG